MNPADLVNWLKQMRVARMNPTLSAILGKDDFEIKQPMGYLLAYASDFQQIPSGSQTTLEYDDVRVDTLGVYNPANNEFTIPENCTHMDWEARIEMATFASGYGSLDGVRTLQMPAFPGFGVVSGAPLQTGASAGIANIRGGGRWCDVSDQAGLQFMIKFSQNSGNTIRIGGSTGIGGGECYVKLWFY